MGGSGVGGTGGSGAGGSGAGGSGAGGSDCPAIAAAWAAWTRRISSGVILTVPRGFGSSSTVAGLGSTKVIWIWPRVSRSPSWRGEVWIRTPLRSTPLLLPWSWIS